MSNGRRKWYHFATVVTRILSSGCPLCRAKTVLDHGFCEQCSNDLPPVVSGCSKCGVPISTPGVCGRCLVSPPVFDHVTAAFPYQFPISNLIRNLKYQKHYASVRPLSHLAAIRFERFVQDLPDGLVPVPLHLERLRRRGFNQSLEIARFLARYFDVKLDWRCVEKIHARQPQTALPAHRRRLNAKGAYVLRHAPRMRHVAIVDDVMTTGATANEIAGLLHDAGVQRIEVWVVARTG